MLQTMLSTDLSIKSSSELSIESSTELLTELSIDLSSELSTDLSTELSIDLSTSEFSTELSIKRFIKHSTCFKIRVDRAYNTSQTVLQTMLST